MSNIIPLRTNWHGDECHPSIRYRIEHDDDANLQELDIWIDQYQIACTVRPVVTLGTVYWDYEISLPYLQTLRGVPPLRLWPT